MCDGCSVGFLPRRTFSRFLRLVRRAGEDRGGSSLFVSPALLPPSPAPARALLAVRLALVATTTSFLSCSWLLVADLTGCAWPVSKLFAGLYQMRNKKNDFFLILLGLYNRARACASDCCCFSIAFALSCLNANGADSDATAVSGLLDVAVVHDVLGVVYAPPWGLQRFFSHCVTSCLNRRQRLQRGTSHSRRMCPAPLHRTHLESFLAPPLWCSLLRLEPLGAGPAYVSLQYNGHSPCRIAFFFPAITRHRSLVTAVTLPKATSAIRTSSPAP